MEILSAKWLVPVASAVISEGSLVIGDGRIIDIGERSNIVKNYPGVVERTSDCVLMPGLVNAHMHLELSHLHNISSPVAGGDFTDWVSNLLLQRDRSNLNRSEIISAINAVLLDQNRSGVALIADVGNEIFSELNDKPADNWPELVRMVEILAPNNEAVKVARHKIAKLPSYLPLCAHAAYSTSSEVLVATKARCRRLNHIFSIHTAENSAELEFLRSGLGCFRDFLEKRRSWDGTFTFTEHGFSGTIAYFDHLGLLDVQTLLVHAVHVSREELQVAADRGTHVCLCPGSNQFLGVGVAPVENMLAVGILPALGTDSRASNTSLDMWREMRLLAAEHAEVDSYDILAMATLGGADSLQRGIDFGSLAIGKSSKILQVSSPALKHCTDGRQIVRQLVSGGRPDEISWFSR